MTTPRRTVVGASLLGLVLAAPPAHADDQPLGVSRDGVRWSDTLEQPLFDPQVRWVPGDVRTARFWVRNQQPDLGRLTVDLTRTRRDALLGSGWLQISARAGDRPWTTVSATGTQQLVPDDALAPDQPMLVEVRVAFDEDAPNGTMVLGTDLDIRATLVDADATSPGGGVTVPGGGPSTDGTDGTDGTDAAGGTDGSGSLLPGTGSDVPPWLPPLAVLLVGAGGFLVVRRRRDDDDPAVEPILRNGTSTLEPGLNGRP